MQLRPELEFPVLDEAKVARLAALASSIDGARPSQWEDDLAEFNHEAGTSFAFRDFQDIYRDFQDIYEGQDHETWVRRILARPQRVADVTRAELVEMARRVMASEGKEHENDYWLDMLAVNIPDSRISDLIYWPGEYFGDGDNFRELTPELVVEIACSRLKDEGREG